jgi:hypothetical protein
MNRKRQIAKDVWDIMRKVYAINVPAPQSAKQELLINTVADYVEAALIAGDIPKGVEEKECSKK